MLVTENILMELMAHPCNFTTKHDLREILGGKVDFVIFSSHHIDCFDMCFTSEISKRQTEATEHDQHWINCVFWS